jgi:hypothetical protein
MLRDHIEEIKKYRQSNWTLQEIGDYFGASAQRICVLLGKTGYIGINAKTRNAIKVAKDNPDKTYSEIANIAKVHYRTLARRMGGKHTVPRGGPLKVGEIGERLVSEKLFELGIENKLMPNSHPFDILVKNKIRVDVKYITKRRDWTGGSAKALVWIVRHKRNHADFFICVTPEKEIFIIPTNIVPSNINYIAFRYPEYYKTGVVSKYIQYKNRFDLLKDNFHGNN